MEGLSGKTFKNRYRVDTFIGRGSMAEVYKVWDQHRNVYLAMKLLHEDMAIDRVFMRRFQREAQTLIRLQHPNIVRFYSLEQEGRLAFMLLDFIAGKTLKHRIFDAQGPLPMDEIRALLRAVCGALQFSHEQGLVHCDIKPGNIMLDEHGRALLGDFGIARLTDAATATMVGAGTPAYMAPEQARGLDAIPQTDIYGLGIVLFEMLTGGERPFTGEQASITGSTSEKVRWEQVHLEPISPRLYNAQISPDLEAVVLKCLQKDPARRYARAMDLFNAFEGALGSDQTSKKTTVVSPVKASKPLPTWECPTCHKAVLSQLEVCPHCEGQEQEKIEDAHIEKRKFPTWGWIAIGIFFFISLIALIYGWSTTRLAKPSSVSNQAFAPVTTGLSPIYFTSTRDAKREIYRLNNTQVEQFTFTPGDGESWDPLISTSGAIYFTSTRDGKREIYRLDDKQVERLTFTAGNHRSWDPFLSPSGLIYFTSDRDGKREIYRLDNKQVERFTFTPGDGESWDPLISTSGTIYFTSTRDGKREIYRLDHEQVERMTFTPGGGESWDPVSTLSGVIYFTSDRDGKREIYRLNEKQVERFTYTPGDGQSWDPFISISRAIYFTSDRDGKREIYRLNDKQVEQFTFTPSDGESWGARMR
ncbi:protein kinase [Chloroflexota bacterium]